MDDAVFSELMVRHRPRTLNYARRLLGNLDAAEDAVQDAWLQVFLHGDEFRGEAEFTTWLLVIVKHECIMHFRRLRPENPLEECLHLPTHGMHPVQRFALWRALRRIPIFLRQTVVLFHVEELPLKEAAKVLRVHPGAFKSRLHRARVMLREQLWI